MRIAYIQVSTIAILLIIAGCSSSESFYRAGYDFSKVDRVAVVAVEGTVKSEAARNQIAEFFAMELLRKGYAPLGRSQVNARLKEQQLSPEELNTAEQAAEVGKILNVPAVLVVNIPHFGEEISIIAALIDVNDGSFLWMGSASAKSRSAPAPDVYGYGIQQSTGLLASTGNEDITGAGITDGPLIIAEQGLTPGETKSVQNTMRDICKTLPPKIDQAKRRFWPSF